VSEIIGGIDGMFLRDWFAGQALAGLAAADGFGVSVGVTATKARQLAEALLAELDKAK
jgi:hypothetical protein